MRCVYLQHSLSINGRGSLRGRQLYDALKKECGATLLGYLVVPQAQASGYDPTIAADVIPEATFLEFDPDLVFIEGGLFTGPDGAWKIDKHIAEEFIEKGGVVVVADVDVNTLRNQRDDYARAAEFLTASAAYHTDEPVVGYDEVSFWKGNKQILCQTDDMIVSDWLRPVYQDVPRILAGLPVRLASFSSILASGNRHSTRSNATDGIPGPDNLPFASVGKVGKGFVVLICGLVTGDAWLEGCPSNTSWLLNVSKFLVGEAAKDKRRTASPLTSEDRIFLSHRKVDAALVTQVFEILRGQYDMAPWIDEDKLIPGDALTIELRSAVAGATVFLLFWSAETARSRWVNLEIKEALKKKDTLIIIVRTAEVPVVSALADRLRIEAFDLTPAQIADQVARAIQRTRLRRRIERLKAESAPPPEKVKRPRRLPSSLTRQRVPPKNAVVKELPAFKESKSALRLMDSIHSDYWIQILSFIDGDHLMAAAGHFDSEDIKRVTATELISKFSNIDCHTGTDGCLSEHGATQRHIEYSTHGVRLIDRKHPEISISIECDKAAHAISSAWSPDGSHIAVASTNYLTIATSDGKVILHHNVYGQGIGSVAWFPAKFLFYAARAAVSAVDLDGEPIWTSDNFGEYGICVTVSPCGRLIAASNTWGEIVLWNERGDRLADLKGLKGKGYWSPARGLAFSPDSGFLAHATNSESSGFSIFDLKTGRIQRTELEHARQLAWLPDRENVLAISSGKQICFYEVA